MNNTKQPIEPQVDADRTRRLAALAMHPRLFGLVKLSLSASCIIIVLKLFGVVSLSWWWVVATWFGGLTLYGVLRGLSVDLKVTPESIRTAFDNADWFWKISGCLAFRVPKHWRRTRLRSGSWRFHVRELSDLVNFTIETSWLCDTKINTLEQYEKYDREFIERDLGGQRLEYRFTKRWRLDAYESSYAAKGMSGLRLVVPCCGTEHHVMVIGYLREHLSAMKIVFEEFIRRAEFQPSPTTLRTVCGGRLQIGTPTGFNLKLRADAEENWALNSPNLSAEITVKWLGQGLPSELTASDLLAVVPEDLKPRLSNTSKTFSVIESGACGILSFGSYDPKRKDPAARVWFAAVFNLPLGARVLVSLEEKDKTDASYYSGLHYVQVMLCVLATIRECPKDFELISFEQGT